MVVGRSFCENRQIWVPAPHFVEVTGDARPWLMARKVYGQHFLFVLIELFSLSVTVPEL